MNQIVNIKKLIVEAEQLFLQGGASCSQAVVMAIRNHFDPSMPDYIISCAVGFGGGVGGSRCMCGTIAGGVLCLGYFFNKAAIGFAAELQKAFRSNHKVSCCHVHTLQAQKQGLNQKEQCKSFVVEVAQKTAEIIAREKQITLV